jgi:hypothetical protein
MQPGSRISATFLQQNAAMYIGLGFLPDWVRIRALTTDTMIELEWSVNMRALACIEGFLRTGIVDTDMDIVDLAYGEGVAHYLGGDVITSGTTPSTTTYVSQDKAPDKRSVNTGYDPIDTWTLDTIGNRTGHWNAECSTTYVGVGSRICVDGKWATVLALTSNGESDDEVTLSLPLPSGNIEFLGPMYDLTTQVSGTVTKPGILVSDTTYLLDAATDTLLIEAGTYR